MSRPGATMVLCKFCGARRIRDGGRIRELTQPETFLWGGQPVTVEPPGFVCEIHFQTRDWLEAHPPPPRPA